MKVFCGHCLDEQEYITKKEFVIKKFKNVTVCFYETVAFCVNCGCEIYVKEREKKNQEAYQDAYCRKIGIVELSVIRSLPSIYNIGIRPLSKMLGWGEVTYTRYAEGFIPTKHYSNEILKLAQDPKYFLKKLNAGKNKISACAYKKALEAAQQRINNRETEIIIKVQKKESVSQNITSKNYVGQYKYLNQAA